jgi:hypothetical protein
LGAYAGGLEQAAGMGKETTMRAATKIATIAIAAAVVFAFTAMAMLIIFPVILPVFGPADITWLVLTMAPSITWIVVDLAFRKR